MAYTICLKGTNMIKTLIITSCCSKKDYDKNNYSPATFPDFVNPDRYARKEAELESQRKKAYDLYTGFQYGNSHPKEERGPLKDAIQILRTNYGDDIVDLYIISAGYGLISENKVIIPYNLSFNKIVNASSSTFNIKSWSQHLHIHEDLKAIISKYDLIFVLLASDYMKAAQFEINDFVNKKVVLIDYIKNLKGLHLSAHNCYFIEPNEEVIRLFNNNEYKPIHRYSIRATIFRDLVVKLTKDFSSDPFKYIYDDLSTIYKVVGLKNLNLQGVKE
jgi:hypothetical protein